MRRYTAEPVTEVRAEHAEGPAWDARRDELLWVDQFAGLVHRGRAGSYIDTPTQRVDVFGLDDAGEPVTRRTAFTVDPAHGAPDGMSIDDEDCLWVALWGSGTLRRYAPSGETLAIVDVPGAPQVSSCAFAGTTLYVTTSQEDYPPALRLRHQGAGQIFAVGLPVGGPPAVPYRG